MQGIGENQAYDLLATGDWVTDLEVREVIDNLLWQAGLEMFSDPDKRRKVEELFNKVAAAVNDTASDVADTLFIMSNDDAFRHVAALRIKPGVLFKAKDAVLDTLTTSLKIAPFIGLLVQGGDYRAAASSAIAAAIEIARKIRSWKMVIKDAKDLKVFEAINLLYLRSHRLEENGFYRADPKIVDIAAEVPHLSSSELSASLTRLLSSGAIKQAGDRYRISF